MGKGRKIGSGGNDIYVPIHKAFRVHAPILSTLDH